MSVALAASPANMSHQPFQCHVCHGRFTRNENLKRHEALHSRSPEDALLCCDFCGTTFARADLRRRHMKKMHPEQEESRATKRLRYDPSAAVRGSDRARCSQRDKAMFAPPAESHNSLTCPQLSHDKPRESDYQVLLRSTTTRPECHQLDHDHTRQNRHGDGWNLANGTPTSIEGDGSQIDAASSPYRLSSNAVTHIDPHIPDATDIEQSLLLGASLSTPPSNHFAVQMLPMMTLSSYSYDADQYSAAFSHRPMDSSTSNDLRRLQEDDWAPSVSQITRGVYLYFTYVSPFVPFLHQPTFDVMQTADYLLLSMLSLAYQHGEDPDCGDTLDSGVSLSRRCFHRARVLLASSSEEKAEDWTRSLATTRAYLLLQLCAMMYLCGEDSAHGLRIHSKMILLVRSAGLMQPIPTRSASESEDLESLWREFIKAESYKRTLFAVHQIDALWYQFLSIPRSLSHLEFKHELPCPGDCWTANSAAQWAHRRLLAGHHASPAVQYGDAVRRFLSPDPDIDSLPAFDPYGAVNIAQFLISSAREITGWSTMTGRLCIERFEPLRSSLEALRPLIRQQQQPPDATATARAATTHPALCAATWEMAMIELQMWSPAHTGGLVGGSIDAVLERSTHLTTPSCEFLAETNTTQALQPHVDWFLRYLDATLVTDSEPPWIAVYAYKAFLIAWQSVRGGSLSAMQAVGIDDGDVEGALVWARKVFARRQRRQLGKLMLKCLEILGE